MGSKLLAKVREDVVNRVSSGTLAAGDAYDALQGGAFTRGEFEALEAQAKAKGLGQWASLGSSDRQAASTYQPRLNPVAVERNQRNGISIAGQPTGMLLPKTSAPTTATKPGGYGLQYVGSASGRAGGDTSLRNDGPDFSPEALERNVASGVRTVGQMTAEERMGRQAPSSGAFGSGVNSAGSQTNYGALLPKQAAPPTYRTPAAPVAPVTSVPAASSASTTNGASNNNVGKMTPPPLPTKSAVSSVQNPYGSTYTGMLLAGAKERAARDYQQREVEMRQRLGAMGATAASAPGLEQQLLTEARQGYARDYGDYERSLMTEATQLGANFDMAKAGSEDAFTMNVGNLGLGYSADARAGALLPGQLTAQGLSNQGQSLQNEAGSFQNKILSNDAYYYTSPEAANNRAVRDKYATELAGTQYEGASLGNAMRSLDYSTQQQLLGTTLQMARNQGIISDIEVQAARKIAAQGGEWYENPLFKNILRGILVGGGALAGGLLLGPAGILPGAAAGGTGAGAIR